MGDKKLYVKNLQGDIMRIVDENGNSIAIYAYDQWGKPTQMRKPSSVNTDLVNYNPFLYRGYVYDSDSGLYYLQSRYYDPTTGRFLNADAYCDTGASVLGTNMFAYCENNSVNFVDPSGTDAWWLQDTDGVYYMGHTSLLIQERPGRWWYFYWGDNRIKLIYIGTRTLKSLNEFLNNNTNVAGKYVYNWKKLRYEWKNYREKIYDGTYERRIVLKGNFARSLSYIYYNLMGGTNGISTKVLISNADYNLFTRNCMQVSMEVLLRGIFYNNASYSRLAISISSGMVVPNLAYNFYIKSQNMYKAIYGIGYAWSWIRSYL